MAKGSSEPFFWALFSSGGMAAAMFMPALVLVLWFVVPLGWVDGSSGTELSGMIANPLVRLALFGFVTLSLFHAAHRLRFTLYDALQLSHLYGPIATVSYAGATVLTLISAYVLFGVF